MATYPAAIATSFKTILFATDFSPASEAALPYLEGLAHCFDSDVIAAYAVPFQPVTGLSAVPPAIEIDYEWQNAQQAMENYKQAHPFTGLRHRFVLERGFLREVVADLVSRNAVDLVVLGTHGRHGLRKLFGGSFAEEIFRSVACPILTVGPAANPNPAGNWKPRRIIFATEFAEGSIHALPYAIALAEANNAELQLLHTVPLVPWQQRSELADLYEQRLRKLVPRSLRFPVDFAVRFDLAGPAILAAAKDKEADLIVMGVHHTRLPKVEAHIPGTTAAEVIANARCPVLTVRG